MRFLIFMIFIWIYIPDACGLSTTDSLKKIIRNQSNRSKESLEAKIELAKMLQRTQPLEAISLCREVLSAAEAILSDTIRGNGNNIIGIAKITIGEKDSALHYYYKAAQIFEEDRNQTGMADAYNNIGRFYRKTEFEKSMDFYGKALAIYTQLQHAEGIATILNESGVAFEYKGMYDSAINRYQASLDIQTERKDTLGISYSLEFLSGAYALKKEMNKALDYNLQALDLRKKISDSFALCLNYNSLAEIYFKMKNYDKAIEHFLRSNDIALRMNYVDILPFNFKLIYQSYQAKQEYDKAIEYVQLYDLYKDSVFNISRNKQIEELSIQYETQKNKSLIQEQEFAIERKNYMLGGAATLLAAGGFIASLYYRRNRLKQQNEIQKVIMLQQEQAAKAIIEAEEEERQRIARDLHDGVGQMMSAVRMNLSVLEDRTLFRSKQQKDDFERIVGLVDDSCKELRTVSHNMMPNSLIKNSLSTAIRNFIDKLDKNALNVQLYTEGLDQRVDMSIESVFYRVIQECVNNVIKHAKSDKLDISIIREQNIISATIEDNGVGFDAKDISNFEGIGLKNIITRVQYLHGTVEFDSAPGQGTVIVIHIPIRQEPGK